MTRPSPEATYERARRLANLSLLTVDLQCRRIQSSEPEDDTFVFRKWADFDFLIVALTRLRRAANLASKVDVISEQITNAITEFDKVLPNLKTMRDVAEHIDDYAIDEGRKNNIKRQSLEISFMDQATYEWLGFKLDANEALEASIKLFSAIKANTP